MPVLPHHPQGKPRSRLMQLAQSSSGAPGVTSCGSAVTTSPETDHPACHTHKAPSPPLTEGQHCYLSESLCPSDQRWELKPTSGTLKTFLWASITNIANSSGCLREGSRMEGDTISHIPPSSPIWGDSSVKPLPTSPAPHIYRGH